MKKKKSALRRTLNRILWAGSIDCQYDIGGWEISTISGYDRDLVQFEAEADSGQMREIEVKDYRPSSPPFKGAEVTYIIGVFFRRAF